MILKKVHADELAYDRALIRSALEKTQEMYESKVPLGFDYLRSMKAVIDDLSRLKDNLSIGLFEFGSKKKQKRDATAKLDYIIKGLEFACNDRDVVAIGKYLSDAEDLPSSLR